MGSSWTHLSGQRKVLSELPAPPVYLGSGRGQFRGSEYGEIEIVSLSYH